MRPSCYFNAVEIGDGNSLLYNGFSMCIDLVPSPMAEELASCGESGDLSFLRPAEKEYLLKRGHITELSVAGEQEALRKVANAITDRGAELKRRPVLEKAITFVLTYQCNLACDYCYQKDVRKSTSLSPMSEAFLDDFFRIYLAKLMPGQPARDLTFLLYGGEPLLHGNRRAIEKILRFAKEHGIIVATVTNAVLLPQMLDLIGPEKGKINNVQVTLDGDRMFHDTKRVSPSGGPTFEQTLLAVNKVMLAGANTVIRIHLHPARVEAARALVDYLDQKQILGDDRVKVYFWSTEDIHTEFISAGGDSLFSSLFHKVACKQHTPPTAHFTFLKQIIDLQAAAERPLRKHCNLCVAGLHCVVDTLGDVYECIDDAGRRERRIATLADGEVKYVSRDEAHNKPYLRDKPQCLQCSIAFYCGGGCSNRLKSENISPASSFCLQAKDFIALTLKSYYLLKNGTA